MSLPRPALEKISHFLEFNFSLEDLQQASISLSELYCESFSFGKEYSLTNFQAAAYLATRLPATYAVCESILEKINPEIFQPHCILDLGGGPGTASLACASHFSTVKEIMIIDRNLSFQRFAEHLFTDYPFTLTYHQRDLTQLESFPPADLVVISYMLNELSPTLHQKVISQAWKATQQVLLLIETGTPKGFSILKEARIELIRLGGKILAPCTHENVCPIIGSDWCHFSTRLQRTPWHQKIKRGSLGYEDEKYAYLMASKSPLPSRPSHRIIRNVLRKRGHVTIDLCGSNGISRKTISKCQKYCYKEAQKSQWGDEWP